ncbi:HlyD family efflux transporter periplasmic adaptor subunit, partial [Streptococcus orisratti]
QLKKGQPVRLTLEKISNHAIVITGKITKIANSATQTKEGNVFEVTALATVGKQDSSKLILFENQNYPLSTCLDELKFYRRLRFLGYF